MDEAHKYDHNKAYDNQGYEFKYQATEVIRRVRAQVLSEGRL